jgi:hypothetical protein
MNAGGEKEAFHIVISCLMQAETTVATQRLCDWQITVL